MNKQRLKRQIGIGGVALAVLICGWIQIGVQRSPAYRLAASHVASMPEVMVLGQPITTRLKLFDFHLSESPITGEAELAVCARGKSGELVVDVTLTKESSDWAVINTHVRE
jgi:hypothetical protein